MKLGRLLQLLFLTACACSMPGIASALDVAEKHLDDLLHQCRNGQGDYILAARMQALYLNNKAMLQKSLGESTVKVSIDELPNYLQEHSSVQMPVGYDECKSDLDTALEALHIAHRLAETRHKAGFATVDTLFETGAELYHATQAYTMWYDAKDIPVPVPSREKLLKLHATITKAATAMGDKERQLQADLLRYRYLEPTPDKVVQLQKAKVERVQQKLNAGQASQWEQQEAKLDLLESEIFLNPLSVDSVRRNMSTYATEAAAFYAHLEKAADAGFAATPEQLLRARLRMLNAAASLQQLEMDEEEN